MIENGRYHHFPYEVYTYGSVDSTNSVAKRAVVLTGDASDMTAHAAGEQSAGRGRRNRTWVNTEGAVLMSIVRKTELAPDDLPMLNLAAAMAVRDAVSKLTDGALIPEIKWPNDLLTPDKLEKICGILSESVSIGESLFAIIGVGLNLNGRVFPEGLIQPASSVYKKTGTEIPVKDAVNAILDEFDAQYEKLLSSREAFLKDYAKLCISLGRHVAVNDGSTVRYGMGDDLAKDGRLIVKFENGSAELISAADVSVGNMTVTDEALTIRLTPKRRHDGNKGDYGRAALIVGSDNMPGAALMCSKACIRSGAGLTRVLIPDGIRASFSSVPEAMLASDADADALLEWADVIGIGCGMGVSDRTSALLRKALLTGKPCVIDADGLNTISSEKTLLKLLHNGAVLTPHPGEMARLTGTTVGFVKDNFTSSALSFAKEHGCAVLLKSEISVIVSPDGEIRYNDRGSSALSKGGSGDVLTGIMTGLLAQGASPFDAATLGAYLLGVSAEKAIELLDARFVCAGDIIDVIKSEINERR